jgi:hypothetical protein
MAENHDYSVEEVTEQIDSIFTLAYVATDDGQAHLNRVGKSISNESIELRKSTNKQNKAEIAFNKVVAKLASTTPEQLTGFIAGKDAWIKEFITKNKA